MADNQDADIDEIIGQEDLELDELDNKEPEGEKDAPSEDEKKPETPDGGEPKGEDDNAGEGKDDKSGEEKPNPDDKSDGEEKPEQPPTPLTKEDVQAAFREARDSERNSTKELEELTDEVVKKYYPEGLTNVLVDEKTGKELRTPQDVIDVTDGKMSHEEAWRWLNNEQQKLDQKVSQIKDQARNIAETNANFSTGIDRVLQKYKPVFEAFEKQGIQQKIYKAFMKQVRMDEGKELVLSSPDVEEFYDLVMEPYLLAYGNMQTSKAGQATQTPPPQQNDAPKIPDSKPSIDDRLDESGDGGGNKNDEADPNDANDSLNKLFGE